MPLNITPEEQQIIDSVTIPPRPGALLKVVDEAKKPEPNIPTIGKAISSDIGISSAVLQVVNSAAFRRMSEIKSIEQAVMLLGLKRVIPLVKAVALKSSMQQSEKLDGFWKRSESIASASVIIAKSIGKADLTDSAYMLGLFHGAGIPIMFQRFNDYGNLLELAEVEGWDKYLDEEMRRYHTSHTTIGAILAEKWVLPEEMITVIYNLHEVDGIYSSDELNDESLMLLSILKIARYAIHVIEFNDSDLQEWLNIRDPLQDYLDLSDSDLEQILSKVSEAIDLS